jgi:hypothetical protein
MYEDFCEECQLRQNPMTQPVGQMGCGAPMPMQGSMGMPYMQTPMMPTMQNPYNIYQPMQQMQPMQTSMPTTDPTSGMIAPGVGGAGLPTQAQFQQTPLGPSPTGPSPIPGVTFPQVPGAPVYQDPNYIQGYLRTLIGQFVRVEFLIGTNSLIDRTGVLLEVGISYIVLREAQTDDNLMCDIFSIKFIRAYY